MWKPPRVHNSRTCLVRLTILFSTFLAFAATTGCNSKVKTVDLSPMDVAALTKNDYDSKDAFYCGSTDDLFWTTGSGLRLGPPVVVGYRRLYDPGTGPTPCWKWESQVSRGLVRFDLLPLSGKAERIVTATLEFDMTTEFYTPPVATNDFTDIVRSIHVVNQQWSENFNIDAEWIFDSTPSLAGHHVDPVHASWNVSSIVRDWLRGTRPNHGFLFVGGDESLPGSQNRIHETTLNGFRLHVLFSEPNTGG